MRFQRHSRIGILWMTLMLTLGCARQEGSISIAYDDSFLLLNPTYEEIPTKIDVLFVVDNSGSMRSSQENLAKNFPKFLDRFLAKKYDFHLAVTTTDAYQSLTHSMHQKALMRRSQSGNWLLTRETPNILQEFAQIAQPGTNGSGDERAFLSFKVALEKEENQQFLRTDAHLAIIIVSDEDDFSHLGREHLENRYDDPRLWSIPDVVAYLSHLKRDYPHQNAAFSVHVVTITDETCLNRLKINAQKIGYRYMDLARATNGQIVSLCDNFGDNLQLIADKIIQRVPLETRFF